MNYGYKECRYSRDKSKIVSSLYFRRVYSVFASSNISYRIFLSFFTRRSYSYESGYKMR